MLTCACRVSALLPRPRSAMSALWLANCSLSPPWVNTPALVVSLDCPRMERVILNLLTNAVKYSPDGGTVAAVSKEPFRWTDTYVLDITDPKDALYVLMFVLAIDAEKCSRN